MDRTRKDILLDKLKSDLSIEKARLHAQKNCIDKDKNLENNIFITKFVIQEIESQIKILTPQVKDTEQD